jgi:hypothetical protein
MFIGATVMSPAVTFQTALNRKAEEVSPAKEHFVFKNKCYISNHSYKIITIYILYFGGTLLYLRMADYSLIF